MRSSLPKFVALSIAALFVGGAFAATPALAAGGHGGFGGFSGGSSGYVHGGGGPSIGGSVSHGAGIPSGGFAPHAGAPHGGVSPPAGAAPQPRYTGQRYRHRLGVGAIGPEWCDDYYCDDYYYYYDDSDCWVDRRVYDKHGKFVGWRWVYVCQ